MEVVPESREEEGEGGSTGGGGSTPSMGPIEACVTSSCGAGMARAVQGERGATSAGPSSPLLTTRACRVSADGSPRDARAGRAPIPSSVRRRECDCSAWVQLSPTCSGCRAALCRPTAHVSQENTAGTSLRRPCIAARRGGRGGVAKGQLQSACVRGQLGEMAG